MSWILQGNPTRFDIRTYITQSRIYWLANRYVAQMQLADHVFIWESGADGGVVAYGYICELPTPRSAVTHPELLADPLWHEQTPDPTTYVVGVHLMRRRQDGFFVPRDAVCAHPDLAILDIVRVPQGTVFRCTPVQVVRLLEM